jgi:hypothetical protein
VEVARAGGSNKKQPAPVGYLELTFFYISLKYFLAGFANSPIIDDA